MSAWGLPGDTWGFLGPLDMSGDVCLGTPGDAWGCLGMPGFAWGCLGMPGDAQGCLGMSAGIGHDGARFATGPPGEAVHRCLGASDFRRRGSTCWAW
jgi:hypothetical protein